MVYLINIILIIIWGILEWNIKNKKISRLLICIISSIQMVFIIGFRDNVGTDFQNYVSIFEGINKFSISNFSLKRVEPGYLLLNRVIGILFGNFSVILHFIIALLTIFFIIKIIYEKSYNCFISIYLFISFCLFYSIMNQSRQGLAISITLYSIKYLINDKRIKYFITILIATTIHYSAIVMLLLLFVYNLEVNFKVIKRYIFISIIALLNINIIISLLQYTKYSIYLGSKYDITQGNSVVINLIFRLILLFIVLYFKKECNKNLYVNILYHMAMLCTLFQCLAVKSSLFARITTYFFISYILLIPEVIRGINNKNLRILTYFCIIICFAIYHYMYFTLMKVGLGVQNYSNIFF